LRISAKLGALASGLSGFYIAYAIFTLKKRFNSYELSPAERDLYELVTDYVRTEMGRAERIAQAGDKKRGNNVGFALTVGTVAGVAINTAHELGHKSARVERALARVALAQSGYGHFYIEHNRGHHNRVATPEDPASSRLGESLYEFLPRTVIGSVRSAWELEIKGLRHRGRRVLGHHNGILVSWSLTVALFGTLTAVFGWKVLPFLMAQAVFGFLLLEVVNYVEHYGLLRQKTERGRYERCRPEHSWNSNHVGSNLVLYNLERHSDHHAHPPRRYQALRHFEEAPQLPNGYGGMITLATIPPLWRKVMDRRVLALYDGDVTRANLHPRTRDRLLARYGRQ